MHGMVYGRESHRMRHQFRESNQSKLLQRKTFAHSEHGNLMFFGEHVMRSNVQSISRWKQRT